MDVKIDIGETIRDVRNKNGLTQTDLADKLGITRSAVNGWEMGTSLPSTQYLIEISKVLKVSVDHLLGLDSNEIINISKLTKDQKEVIYAIMKVFEKPKRSSKKKDLNLDISTWDNVGN